MKNIAMILCAASLLCGCVNTPQKSPECIAIETVYTVDRDIAANSKTIAEALAKEKSISLAGCPADFTKAYKANIAAWEKMADIEKKMYASGNISKAVSDIKDYLSKYQSDPTAAAVNLKTQWTSLSQSIDSAAAEIARTFGEYTSIGAKYGAIYGKSNNIF